MTHNSLMHEAGRHDKRLPAGQCAHCDDAEAADRLRAIYDRTGMHFQQVSLDSDGWRTCPDCGASNHGFQPVHECLR